MRVGIPKEIILGERRVALVPELVSKINKAGFEIYVQAGAGIDAGIVDDEYANVGARIEQGVLNNADVILKVRRPTQNEIGDIRENSVVIGLLEPYSSQTPLELLASRKITAFAMELMPRIARAQAMDALSAMSTIAGYKAVLLAANHLSKFFPLLMTAAGTIPPARSIRYRRWRCRSRSHRDSEAARSCR